VPEPTATEGISREELQLAVRNHGMPLEALRYPVTPAGLHYLLIHFDIPAVDPATWELSVDGLVRAPLRLTLDDLRGRPRVTAAVTLECAGNGRALLSPRPISQPWLAEAVGTAEWTGTPLRPILDEAGIGDRAVEVLFTGIDRGVDGGIEQDYARSLALDEALREDLLLAYEMNGDPLLPQHGFPVRLVVPGWYGMTHVKWLRAITILDEPFGGYQQAVAYRWMASEDDPGTVITRILPRSLMVPPGIPDFFTRERFVSPGEALLEGRAWSGWGRIERVEVSTDGGVTWSDASLGEAPSAYAWVPWSHLWNATPGRYELMSRATDATGRSQPIDPPWNVKGYANNAAQRLTVIVGQLQEARDQIGFPLMEDQAET
jgi:sulfane dehydrogenase subunit SoxC